MGIIIKHTLRNMIKKPFRTLLIVICITACAFSALLCFDMSNAIGYFIKSYIGSMMGSVDVEVSGQDIPEDVTDDEACPETVNLNIYASSSIFTRRLSDQYQYFHQDYLVLYGLDMDVATQMKSLPYSVELSDRELVLSKQFADLYGYEEGEAIVLQSDDDKCATYTVKMVYDYAGKSAFDGYSAIMSVEGLKRFDGEDTPIALILMDVKNDADNKAVYEYLKEHYPDLTITSITEDPSLKSALAMITRLFFILFAVCLFMVIFVTISMSERIVIERMSTIGTLRSLGISNTVTTIILLLENALYGFVGGTIGCALYSVIRTLIFTGLFTTVDADGNKILAFEGSFGTVKITLYLAIILSAMLIECLCPMKEVIKAIKTPIRDIIFDNKDTEHHTSRVAVVFGILLLILSVIAAFFRSNFIMDMICFAALISGFSLLFPLAIKKLAAMLVQLLSRMNTAPLLKLAMTEVATKKSTIGSATLIATSIALTVVVVTLANSFKADSEFEMNCADLTVTCANEKRSTFSFIENLEGVTDVQYQYSMATYVKLCGERELVQLIGYDPEDFKYDTTLSEFHLNPSDEEVVISINYAKKYHLKEGDPFEITFEGYYPITKTLRVAKIINAYHFDSTGMYLILSKNNVMNFTGDYPTEIDIMTDNPKKTQEQIRNYAAGKIASVVTREEALALNEQQGAQMQAIIWLVMVLGIGISFVGAVTNMLIGFEGRKRECAVLCSTSITRSQMSRVLLYESLIATLIALIAGGCFGSLLIFPVYLALAAIPAYLPIVVTVGAYIFAAILLLIAYTMTSIFPIGKLRKMGLAEQLKYE